MSKMIQVRNVPDEMHRALKVKAANEGLSLSDYIKRELVPASMKLTIEEAAARAKARGPSGITAEGTVRIIREMRGE